MITRGKVFTIVAFVWSLIPIPPPFSLVFQGLLLPMLIYVIAGRKYVLWFWLFESIWAIPGIIETAIYGGYGIQPFLAFYQQINGFFAYFIPSFVTPTPFVLFVMGFVFAPAYCIMVYLMVTATYRKAKKIYARVPSYRRS